MRRLIRTITEGAGRVAKRVMPTRHAGALEKEMIRLKAENRALLNSILGIAGVPPVVTDENGEISAEFDAAPEMPEDARSESKGGVWAGAPKTGFRSEKLQKAAPMRGRSWRQIAQMLEFEALQKMRRETDNGIEITAPTRKSQPKQ